MHLLMGNKWSFHKARRTHTVPRGKKVQREKFESRKISLPPKPTLYHQLKGPWRRKAAVQTSRFIPEVTSVPQLDTSAIWYHLPNCLFRPPAGIKSLPIWVPSWFFVVDDRGNGKGKRYPEAEPSWRKLFIIHSLTEGHGTLRILQDTDK